MTREEKRQRREAMKVYKAEGHSIPEVAEHFGVSEGTAQSVCKGIAPQTQRRPINLRNQYTADSEKARASRINRIIETLKANAPGFEYAGGYTDGDGTVRIRCRECGNVETRTWNTLRHKAITGRIATCPICAKEKVDRAREHREAEAEAKKKARAERSAWNKYERSIKQWTFAVCKECGELFMQTAKNSNYCSEKFRKKHANNHKDRRLRGKAKDRSITLLKLYKRDAGVCHICGGLCDWADYEDRDGVKIAGNNYPSIDHVIPIARGGEHTWDNVKLAHRLCNTKKKDSPSGQTV